MPRFHNEDEIEAAYDAAEMVLEGFIDRDVLLLMDERSKRQTIGMVSRAIADAVIRSEPDLADITTLPEVHIERAG